MRPSPIRVTILEVIAKDGIVVDQSILKQNGSIKIEGNLFALKGDFLGTMDDAISIVQNVAQRKYAGLIIEGKSSIKDLFRNWEYKLQERKISQKTQDLYMRYVRKTNSRRYKP